MKIDNKEFLNPQQQLYENTKDIEKLKADYMPVYSYRGLIGSTTQNTLPRSSTNVPEGVNLGWIMDYTGKLFKITDGSATTLLIDYYAQIKGPKGDTGNTGPQGETGPQGPKGEPGQATIGIEVVASLPSTGEEGVLYFVPKQDSEIGDEYEEYAYVDGEWELLGGAQVDLTNYALKSELPVIDENIIPKTNSTYDLGSADKNYKKVYTNGIKNKYFDILTAGVNNHGVALISTTDNNGNTENTVRIDDTGVQVSKTIKPKTTDTIDLGTSGLKYKDLYLAGNLTDGTNSVAIANIAKLTDIPTLPTYSISNVVRDGSDVLGLQVTDGNVSYNIYNTTANPTLAGTESDLTSVDIGGTSYKIPSFSGSYTDLTNKPTLGTAAAADTGTSSGDVPVLDANGKLSTSVLPAIAVTDTFVVSSEAAMLALTAQVGDIAVRTDLNKSFILQTDGASTLSHWQELLTPTDSVTSVNGQTGAVTLTIPTNSDYVDLTSNQDITGTKTVYNMIFKYTPGENNVFYQPLLKYYSPSGMPTHGLQLPIMTSWNIDKTIATTDQIPTKTSELTNDSGFITSSPVTSVNGHTGSVTVTQADLNIVYSATQPSNPVNGTIWIKPTN